MKNKIYSVLGMKCLHRCEICGKKGMWKALPDGLHRCLCKKHYQEIKRNIKQKQKIYKA